MSCNFKRAAFPAACVALLAGLTIGAPARAATVEAVLSPLGGPTWEARFSVTAAPGQTIEAFSVFFDAAAASRLVVQASPAGWDSLIVQPDSALGADGYFDALALAGGITADSPATGFAARFDWADVSLPLRLRYTVNDPLDFASLESGAVTLP